MSQANFWKHLSQNSTKSFSSIHIPVFKNVDMEIHCFASFGTSQVDTDGYNIENSINFPNWKDELMFINTLLKYILSELFFYQEMSIWTDIES